MLKYYHCIHPERLGRNSIFIFLCACESLTLTADLPEYKLKLMQLAILRCFIDDITNDEIRMKSSLSTW